MISLNRNILAVSAANNLASNYSLLAASTERLSTGLRVNSAADDAAGLAIRELMRADVAALHQGVRNANDAISMLQVADGALAVIDEKLIRMKELAEQAATGTYDSTQRLMIHSEFQAMGEEIDRIARATNFNGIKLLDGSLSGTHNGKGLNSTGAMKIHFGTLNDSAEDYYYVSIGDCTTRGLGLGSLGGIAGSVTTWVTRYETEPKPISYAPATSYVEYTDPQTGNKYYNGGDFYFTNLRDPGGTALDWATDGELIARLVMQQDTTTSTVRYQVYNDAVTNTDYYSRDSGKTFLTDPNDQDSALNPANAGEKAVIDRLKSTNKNVNILTRWRIWENPDGRKYYSCDDGHTYVPNTSAPDRNVLDSSNPDHQAVIEKLKPVLTSKQVSLPTINVEYECYHDPVTNIGYYTSDGGATFVTDTRRPDTSVVDPAVSAVILARLERTIESTRVTTVYDRYIDPVTNTVYLTSDRRKTFVLDVTKPDDIALDSADPAEAAIIDRLEPDFFTRTGHTNCSVYEDTANGNKRYYSKDNGATYFDDLGNPAGSVLDINDPAYAGLVANFQKRDEIAVLQVIYDQYNPIYIPHIKGFVFSADGGKTFVSDENDPESVVLDISRPGDKDFIDMLEPVCKETTVSTTYNYYVDKITGISYISLENGPGDIFYKSIWDLDAPALDGSIASQKVIIDRLEPQIRNITVGVESSFPAMYWVFEDPDSGKVYYSPDNGNSFTPYPDSPYRYDWYLDPAKPADKAVIDKLRPTAINMKTGEYMVAVTSPGLAQEGGAGIYTQDDAQKTLVAIDRAIVSKDKIRAHLGALQNRFENTVTNLTVQSENLQAAESRISDTDVATEMTAFVRNQILTQSATAMLSQANSFPHMMMTLFGG